jgi:hypothetical protein
MIQRSVVAKTPRRDLIFFSEATTTPATLPELYRVQRVTKGYPENNANDRGIKQSYLAAGL